MILKFIEGTNGFNWGKFLLMKFTADEWSYISKIDGFPLLRSRGWGPEHIWVMDVQTGEGFCTAHGGLAVADLQKHEVWVCPMFEPFLQWLYTQDVSDLTKLPAVVELEGESALAGYRRSGLKFEEVFSAKLRKVLKTYKIFTFRQLCGLTEDTFKVLVGDDKERIAEVRKVFSEHGFRFLETRRK